MFMSDLWGLVGRNSLGPTNSHFICLFNLELKSPFSGQEPERIGVRSIKICLQFILLNNRFC